MRISTSALASVVLWTIAALLAFAELLDAAPAEAGGFRSLAVGAAVAATISHSIDRTRRCESELMRIGGMIQARSEGHPVVPLRRVN